MIDAKQQQMVWGRGGRVGGYVAAAGAGAGTPCERFLGIKRAQGIYWRDPDNLKSP